MTSIAQLLAAWVMSHSAAQAAEPPIPFVSPKVAKAEPAPEWNAKFDGKSGWIGGDCAYSVQLSPTTILWLFGDSLLGKVKDGRRVETVMANNTIAIQTGVGPDGSIRFSNGKTAEGKPAAFITPADGKGWFWPQAGVVVGARLLLFLPQIEKTAEEGAFGFKHVNQRLAIVEKPDDPGPWRIQQHKIPFVEFGPKRERSWGSAAIADGNYLYIFGYDDEKAFGKRHLTLARVPQNKPADFEAWRFRTATGWSTKADDAARLAAEFSVSRLPGGDGFALIYTENGLGERIMGRFARGLEDAWSAPTLLYQCPEMAKDKGVFSYAAKAHPWATQKDEFVISYCVNSWKFERLFEDEGVYRPKFVRVALDVKKGPQ